MYRVPSCQIIVRLRGVRMHGLATQARYPCWSGPAHPHTCRVRFDLSPHEPVLHATSCEQSYIHRHLSTCMHRYIRAHDGSSLRIPVRRVGKLDATRAQVEISEKERRRKGRKEKEESNGRSEGGNYLDLELRHYRVSRPASSNISNRLRFRPPVGQRPGDRPPSAACDSRMLRRELQHHHRLRSARQPPPIGLKLGVALPGAGWSARSFAQLPSDH